MQQLLAAKWVLPISGPAQKNAAVVFEDDKIIAVGPSEKLNVDFPDASARDFGRSIILPGFVDLHTHLEYAAFCGVCEDLPYTYWKIQQIEKARALDEADWKVSARLGAIEAAQSGITTIADISRTGASLKAAVEMGLRGVIYIELAEMDQLKVDSIIETAKGDVEEWRNVAAASNIQIGVAPMSPHSACAPLIKAASDWAREDGLKVCTHLAGSKAEYDFIKYGSSALASAYRDAMGWSDLLWQPTGVSPVRYMLQWGFFDNDVLAVHCVHVDDDDIHALAEHNVAIAHCPKCSAKLAMGTAPLDKFMDAGLRVGLGTDSPASNNIMDFFDEMRTGLLFQRSMNHSVHKAEAASYVRMATLGGAEALGMEESIGTIEPGKQADLTVVDMTMSHQRPLTDPYAALVYTASQANVLLTIGAGKVLYDQGVGASIDVEKTMRDIEPVRMKLR